jgi:hypothetical protein
VSVGNQESLKAFSEVAGDSWFAQAHWAKPTESLISWDRKFAFSTGTLVNRGIALFVTQLEHAERNLLEARSLGFCEIETPGRRPQIEEVPLVLEEDQGVVRPGLVHRDIVDQSGRFEVVQKRVDFTSE